MTINKDGRSEKGGSAATVRQKLNTMRCLEEVWSRLVAGDENWADAPDWAQTDLPKDVDAPHIQTDVSELIADGTGAQANLGPVPRLLVLREELLTCTALGETENAPRRAGTFLNALFAYAARNGTDFDWSTASYNTKYDERLRLSSPTRPKKKALSVWRQLEDAMLELLNEHHSNRTAYTRETVFEARYEGPEALVRFRQYIANQEQAEADPPMRFIAISDKRKQRMHAICEAVAAPELAQREAMLLNVHCGGRWRDGAAFAQTLEAKLNARPAPHDTRIVKRITLARYAQSENQNPGAAHSISFDELIQVLVKAFKVSDQEITAGGSRVDSASAIRAIRRSMARRPHVIIFENYYEAGGEPDAEQTHAVGTEMLRVIRDDHFKKLILRLMEPPIADDLEVDPDADGDGEPLDLNRFRENRFVVISNRKLDYFSADANEGDVDWRQEEIPEPTLAELTDILESSELTYRDVFVHAVHDSNCLLGQIRFEPFFDLLDAHLKLAITPEPGEEDGVRARELIRTLLEKVTDRTDLGQLDQLMDLHLQFLRENDPAMFELHLLLATAACGLKDITLSRIERRMRAMAAPTPPFAALRAPGATSEIAGRILADSGGLLTNARSDVFYGFDNAPPIFETALLDDGDQWPVLSRTANDFDDPVMKESVNRLIGQRKYLDGAHELAVVHRLLSEEALSQQTVALRDAGVDYTPSIRAFRRMITAIFHGLLSLPLQKNANGDPEIDPNVEFVCPYFAAARNPREFYVWIYQFLYRRCIERPPAWNLSRHYSLDRLKADLLEAIDRPWTIQQTAPPDLAFAEPASLIEATFSAAGRAVVEDYLINYAHALTAQSRVKDAVETGDRRYLAPGMEQSWGKPRFELRHLKDRFNIALLTQDPIAADCMNMLWQALAGAPGVALDEAKRPEALRAGAGRNEVLAARADAARGIVESAIDEGAKAYFGLLNEGAPLDSWKRLPSFRDEASELFELIAPDDAATVSTFCDALYRVSELIAIDADFLRSTTIFRKIEIENRNAFAKLETLRNSQSGQTDSEIRDAAYKRFCRALATYKLAEQIRLEVFRRDPGGWQFFHSGHAARACIRTTLILERQARKVRFKGQVPGDTRSSELRIGLFSREARRISDRVTKHLFRYARERASLQIIEATIHRVLSEPVLADERAEPSEAETEFHRQSLNMSRRYLAHAERTIISQSRKNRVRMRFILERTKVNQAMWSISKTPEEKERYFSYAEYDALDLKNKANQSKLAIWIIIAGLQVQNIQDMRKRMNSTG